MFISMSEIPILIVPDDFNRVSLNVNETLLYFYFVGIKFRNGEGGERRHDKRRDDTLIPQIIIERQCGQQSDCASPQIGKRHVAQLTHSCIDGTIALYQN